MIYQANYWKVDLNGTTLSYVNDKDHFLDVIFFEELSTEEGLSFAKRYADCEPYLKEHKNIIVEVSSIEEFRTYPALSDGRKVKERILFQLERNDGKWSYIHA